MNWKEIAKKAVRYLVAYLMWVVVMLLGVWFILISREGLIGALKIYYVGTSFTRNAQVQLIDKAYPVIVGLIWLVMMIVAETSFRNGVKQGNLLNRFARYAGPELLLIFFADLLLFSLAASRTRTNLQLFIMAVELIVGVLLVIMAYRLPHKVRLGKGGAETPAPKS